MSERASPWTLAIKGEEGFPHFLLLFVSQAKDKVILLLTTWNWNRNSFTFQFTVVVVVVLVVWNSFVNLNVFSYVLPTFFLLFQKEIPYFVVAQDTFSIGCYFAKYTLGRKPFEITYNFNSFKICVISHDDYTTLKNKTNEEFKNT